MTDSILQSTKKILGIDPDYDVWDLDIITHINSVFMTLQQLGVGPDDGFAIVDDSTTWHDYLGADKQLNSARTYMFLRIRLIFDPPGTSYLIESLRKQAEEIEWRLNVHVDTGER